MVAFSKELQRRAHQLIPGGAHTYAKGDDQYPVNYPSHIVRGKGCHVWDSDGHEYIEYGMGNRAVALGHAFEPVTRAVREALENGANFSRPAALEIAAAEKMLSVLPGEDMIKFCKDGADATTGAVRIARAYTGRDLIAICEDHPFFSVDDWFIGATAMHGGVPEDVRKLTVKFRYNDLASVKALVEKYPGQIAGFILEPAKGEDPKDGFLHKLKQIAHDNGALFILDEMITGFRVHHVGAQQKYDIQADLSTWGKALGNGFAISALTGKREFMRLGDLTQTEKPRVFLLSTTHGGETHSLAALMAVIDTYINEPVIDEMARVGTRLMDGVAEAAKAHDIADFVYVSGMPSNAVFGTRGPDGAPSQGYRSLLLQELAKHGVLAPSLVVSYAHTDADIDRTIQAFSDAFTVYARALEDGFERHLIGRPSTPVYRTWNA
jgi:glutamate-1-semialdehyde 2,1-aminomutase